MKGPGIVFTGKDQLEVQDREVGDPKAGQLLVEAHASLISTGTECICLGRKFSPGTGWDGWVKYPFYPGYSLAGRVLKVGPDVQGFAVGDRVMSACPHARYALADPVRTVKIPDAVPAEQAAWGTLAYITQHGFRRGEVRLGENVVIVGAGLLGQLVTQYAAISGAGKVIVIDTADQRLAMAAAHGATHTLNMPVDKAKAQVDQLTDGKGAEVVFDITGHAAVFAGALGLVRRFGRLILVGDTGTPEQQHLIHAVIGRDITIRGAHDTNAPIDATDFTPWSKRAMTSLFYQLIVDGRIRVGDLITHRFAVEDAQAAYDLLTGRREQAMGVVFTYGTAGSPQTGGSGI